MPSSTMEATPTLYESTDTVETPTLLVDLATMEANIRDYALFAESNDITLRPHVKTHKIPDIAHLQREFSGRDGIVCQTLGEAEIMAQNGIDDIYLSYQVVGQKKLERAVRLSRKLSNFMTTVDDEGNIRPLQRVAADHGVTIDVILEIDVGLHRTGVPPGERALEEAERVQEAPNLNLRGLLAYEAHVKSKAETRADYERYCTEAMDRTQETVDRLEDAGIPIMEVKVGGTATSKYSGTHPVVTEINPGMYPFMDVGELEHRPFDIDKSDCAATVVSTVISKPTTDRAVVDAGSKALSMDKPQLPVPKHRNDISYVNASEEHGWLDTSESERPIEVGDRIEFIVPHVCATINLYDTIVGARDDCIEELWDVAARGAVR